MEEKDFYQAVEQLSLRFPTAEIADNTGFTKSQVSKILRKKLSPSRNFIDTFYQVYGEKLKNGKTNEATDLGSAKATYVNKAGNDFIELSGGKYIMNTPLITKKAYAGYLAGWGDDEYLNDLPKHPIVVDKPHLGYYHSFEVSGDSMDDGTARAIQNGDIVTGRKIDRGLWKSKLHLSKFRDFVIVSLEGIVCKEIVAHDTTAGIITCHSLNPDKETYPDFEIELAKVIQIFNIVQVTKKR